MKLNYISTYSLNSSLRNITLGHQSDLAAVQKEVATGKKHDIGNELGTFSSSVVSFSSQIEFMDQLQVTNSLVENRYSVMQSSMGSVIDSATDFLGQVTAELNSNLDPGVLKALGDATLSTLGSALNVTFRGEFVFSGINTDSTALNDYNGPSGAPAKAAVQAAFNTAFGFNPGDPAAQNITPAAMEAFIDGPYMDLFDDTNWQTLWSNSSDRGIRSKISTRELVETPVTANDTAFRTVTASAILISEFSSANLSEDTFNALAEKAVTTTSVGISQLGDEQSKLGVVEERVSDANDRMEFQKNILSQELSELTDVDPYETAFKLNQLLTSLEASYAATARIQSLSLLNFI